MTEKPAKETMVLMTASGNRLRKSIRDTGAGNGALLALQPVMAKIGVVSNG